MEKDDEVKGQGNSLDFGARIYDSRVGRWLSRDALEKMYVPFSPHCFALNNPVYLKDADGNIVVDRNGNPVTVSITAAENGTNTATYKFQDGTSQVDIDYFMKNGGKVISTLIQVESGLDQVKKVISSTDRIHTTVITSEINPEPTETNEGIKLGSTYLCSLYPPDCEGERCVENKVKVIQVNVFEGSIDEAVRVAKSSEYLHPEHDSGVLMVKNKLNRDQKIASVASHEYEHATNPIDVEMVKNRTSMRSTDPKHKPAYDIGEKTINEFGDKNRKP